VEAAPVESAKRRGRPKKNIAVMTEPVVESETIIVEAPIETPMEAASLEVQKHRGRPKKTTSEPRPDEEKAPDVKPPANEGQTAKKNLFASGTR